MPDNAQREQALLNISASRLKEINYTKVGEPLVTRKKTELMIVTIC